MHPRVSLSCAAFFLTLAAIPACGTTSADREAAMPMATATPDEPADETATLEILSVPTATVTVDGKPAGKTPIRGFKVQPGQHDVTFTDDTGPRTMSVTVAPGEARMVKSDRAPGIIEKRH